MLQVIANGLANGATYAIVALGFALVYNTTRVFHLAHGAVYTVAGYLCFWLVGQCGWRILPAVALSLVLASLVGLVVEYIVYAPLRRINAGPLITLLSSLGVYILISNLVALLFGSETQFLRSNVGSSIRLGHLYLAETQIAQLVAAAIILPLALIILRFTKFGKAIRAIHDNSGLASAIGLDAYRVAAVVVVTASVLAGTAGIISALDVGVDPYTGMPVVLIAAVAVIVGGVSTFGGSLLGGFLLGIIQSIAVWLFSAKWTDTICYVVLIMFLLFRPQGLLGSSRRLEEV